MQMGEALICAFLNAGICTPDRISVSVRSEERSQRMLSLGVQVWPHDAFHGLYTPSRIFRAESSLQSPWHEDRACFHPLFIVRDVKRRHICR